MRRKACVQAQHAQEAQHDTVLAGSGSPRAPSATHAATAAERLASMQTLLDAPEESARLKGLSALRETDPEVFIDAGLAPALAAQLTRGLKGSSASVRGAALAALNQLSAACVRQHQRQHVRRCRNVSVGV